MILKTDINDFQNYLTDASNLKGSASHLFVPENINEVQAALSECTAKKMPITIRGAGTSTTGASVPQSGALVSSEKLKKIIEIDPKKMSATVECGVSLSELDTAISDFGLFYPVNPTETDATIGGNVATNASGARTFKYGATYHNINKLSMLTIDGHSTLNKKQYSITNKNTYDYLLLKSAAGYNPNCMPVGSEGTLGFIDTIELKLLAKPEAIMGFFIFFDTFSNVFDFVETVKKTSFNSFSTNGIFQARLIEYFDSYSLKIIKDKFGDISGEAQYAIWIEQEYKIDNEAVLLEKWFDLIAKYTPLADDTLAALDDAKHREFANMRHSIPEHINELTSRRQVIKMATDTAVPHDKFAEHFDFINKTLNASGIEHISFGHIGNCHIHTNFLPDNDEHVLQAKKLNLAIIKNAIRLKGTVSAEHGIGKIKKLYFDMMQSNVDYQTMLRYKKNTDPQILFGRGNIFQQLNPHC